MEKTDKISLQKIKHLENEIKLFQKEKKEYETKWITLYTKMEEEVRRRTSQIQTQNLILKEEIEKRKQAEHNLRKSLVEKDFIFKELHHRVKNNLQLISSILNLQIKDSDNIEVKQILKESQQKLKSMALIHDFIYDSDSLDTINLSKYLTFLSQEIFNSSIHHHSMRKLHIDIPPNIVASQKTSLPCGLIVNELLQNAIKYAFGNDEKGDISITLIDKIKSFIIIVADNGIGIDQKTMFKKNHNLGLNLVKLLVEKQLKGTLNFSSTKGTKIEISIPNELQNL